MLPPCPARMFSSSCAMPKRRQRLAMPTRRKWRSSKTRESSVATRTMTSVPIHSSRMPSRSSRKSNGHIDCKEAFCMQPELAIGVREVANRVPQVTADFWLVKLLAVTMGETAADYLAVNLGLGLATTSWIMSAILVVFIFLQFRQKRYVPWPYWTAVVMISVVGTLITDNLVDNLGVPLETTTVFFTVALALTFAVWYWSERTLSIHTVVTTRRE